MKTFKQFLQAEEVVSSGIANVSANIDKYDPVMKFKLFRRKRKKEKIT